MDNKLILPCEVEDVSDGYHTFKELYEHRITLFILLCKTFSDIVYYDCSIPERMKPAVWRSKLHSDETSWEGWFIMGINKEDGEQITYHLPESKWDDTYFAKTLDKAPEFDGHTPEDVLERLKNL